MPYVFENTSTANPVKNPMVTAQLVANVTGNAIIK
jgi:hypothetical protein